MQSSLFLQTDIYTTVRNQIYTTCDLRAALQLFQPRQHHSLYHRCRIKAYSSLNYFERRRNGSTALCSAVQFGAAMSPDWAQYDPVRQLLAEERHTSLVEIDFVDAAATILNPAVEP